MKIKTIVFFTLIIALIQVTDAFAHKVILFAWVEDGVIYTESQFGSKSKAKNCIIKVYNDKGDLVHDGKTDMKGKYSFKIPENIDSDLLLKLEAGPGHQAKWTLSKEELTEEPKDNKAKVAIKEKNMAEKEKIEAGPSIFKIIGGIGIIFLLAFAAQFLKRKISKK